MNETVNVYIVVFHPGGGFGKFIIMNQPSVQSVADDVKAQGFAILDIREATRQDIHEAEMAEEEAEQAAEDAKEE